MPMCAWCDNIYSRDGALFRAVVCMCTLYVYDCDIYVCLNLFAQHPTVTGNCDTAMSHPYPFVLSDFRLWSHFHSILFYAIS